MSGIERQGRQGWTSWAGVGGMNRAPLARDNNGPASTVGQESRARGGYTSYGKVRFGDRVSLQWPPPSGTPV